MRLSRFIQQHMQSLLTEWDRFARSNAPTGHGMSDVTLRDHAEEILAAIAKDIETPQSDAEQQRKSEGLSDAGGTGADATAAAVHGALRQRHEFSLLQLTAEYRALRATVLRQWLPTVEHMDAAHAQEMVRFNEAIDQALAESVIAYDEQSQCVRDVAESARRESDERYHAILATALDYAIFTIDADGIIDSWPPGAEAVFGWQAGEAIGQHFSITYTDEDRAAGIPEQEMRAARDDGVAPDVRWHVCKDGRRVFIEGAVRPLARSAAAPVGYLKAGRDATERKRWDERQQVLHQELQHRTRNVMGVVMSTFDKTRRGTTDIETLARTYKDRLAALARVQGLLSRLHEGDRVAFDTLIRTELSAMGAVDEHGRGDRVELRGPDGVLLRSGSVQTLALALHELATNATKYGALAQDRGRLRVHWQVKQTDERPLLCIEWVESCVDMSRAADTASGTGYGRELIERALPYQLGARTDYQVGPDGVRCSVELPISDAAAWEAAPHA